MHTQLALSLAGIVVAFLGGGLIYVSLCVLQHNDPVLIAGGVCVASGILLVAVSLCCGGTREESPSTPPRQAAARPSAPRFSAPQQETPEQVAARRQAGLQKLRDLELGRM